MENSKGRKNQVKKRATESDFTLLSAALSLAPSLIGSLLFKDGITAVRESLQMCKDIKEKMSGTTP